MIPLVQVVVYKHCQARGPQFRAAAKVVSALGQAGLFKQPDRVWKRSMRCLTATRQIVCYGKIAVPVWERSRTRN